MNTPTPATPATPAGPYVHQGEPLFKIDTLPRKRFNTAVLKLFGRGEGNMFPGDDLKADRMFENTSFVEVFNSPEGLIVAIHEFNGNVEPWIDVVHVLRPATVDADGFRAWDAADDRNLASWRGAK